MSSNRKKITFSEELLLCLRADFPLLFVITQEERRALSLIKLVTETLNRRLIFPRIRGQAATVQTLLQKTDESGTVVVLDNIHRMLGNGDTVRSLVDAVSSGDQRSVIVIAPDVCLPPELERLSTLLHLPLPSEELLLQILMESCESSSVILSEKDQSTFIQLAKGMTMEEAGRAFKKALLGWPESVDLAIQSVLRDKQSALHNSVVLSQVEISPSINNVGGLDRLKKWLSSRKTAFSDQAKLFGLPAPKGLLLMGVQGCGKSLTAKSIAGYWQLPLVRLDLSLLFGEVHPETALSSALNVAEAMAPVVLWVDELEKGFDNTNGTSSRVLGGLVTWLQEKQKEVFVVATANRVSGLPPELPRKGRFDEIFFVDLPDEVERQQILNIHLQLRKRDPNQYNIEKLARKAVHFSGSELEQVVISGMFQAFSRGEELTEQDMLFSIQETVPLHDTFEEEIKNLREWARKRARPASTDRRKSAMFQS